MRLDATYRLQFRNGMTFDRAAALVPYLDRLGVSHLYASPVFAATSGSTHGYDVTDYNSFDPALGGEAGFLRLSDALRSRGMGLVLDIVPNHMAASTENPWWASVLEWGEASPFASHFDIDWQAGYVTLPFLGATFEECLRRGEFSIAVEADGRIVLKYYENRWPLAPSSYGLLLDRLQAGPLVEISAAAARATPAVAGRLHGMIRDALRQSDVAARIEAHARDPDLVRRLHEAQFWRLYDWHEGRKHLTYRRFFEITGLVGVRVEQEEVFRDVHRTVLEQIAAGRIDGLRIDHVDGLADPTGYLQRLREAVGADLPIHVEKILEGDEQLVPDWPVEGTTGYEFIATLARTLIDGDGLPDLDAAYAGTLGAAPDYAAACYAAKREIITWNLEGELGLLAGKADALARTLAPDLAGRAELREALVEVTAGFPVYRTYVNAAGPGATDTERLREIEAGIDRSARAGRLHERQGFIFRLLRLDVPERSREAALEFVARFQQTTGPVMAKAIEDTLFYRFSRLLALNEVGGDPLATGTGAATFHAAMEERAGTQPRGLSATATHDTKRGEDSRARLYTISEAPEEWSAAVERWRDLHSGLVRRLGDGPAPDAETEWMLYQALLGAWPVQDEGTGWLADFRNRFLAFVEKAMREDKRRTRWTAVNEPYEEAVRAYAARLVDPANGDFLADFRRVAAPFVAAGAINSLAQVLVKLTAPGVPDIYNGTESWDLSFVDPDNRRPVDFDALALAIEQTVPWPLRIEDLVGGKAKQHLVASALNARRGSGELFAEGSYRAVPVTGGRAEHVVAFRRSHAGMEALVVFPRLVLALVDGWSGIPPETWSGTRLGLDGDLSRRTFVNVLTGEEMTGGDLADVSTALATAPVGFFLSRRGQ